LNTNAGNDGSWKINLAPMEAGGPFEFKVEGKNSIILKNVMVGEVWICSGQSNMEFTLQKSDGGEEEISKADFPLIRIFIVKHKVAETPLQFCDGEWQICSPKTISQFSGVAYFFGKNLLKELNVPIGLIQTTWGGSPAEAWMSKEALITEAVFKPILTRWDKKMQEYPLLLEEFNRNEQKLIDAWKVDSADAVNKGMAPPRRPSKPDGPGTRNQPAGLFNGMIFPLAPFSFQGVIWYQGEANASRANQYRKLFPALIKNWRALWSEGDFPFFFVQLPNLNREPEPSKSGWAELREAQLMTLTLPNTSMAVTIDIGDPTNLHPTNKSDVGFRLSLIALSKVYNKEEISFSGPIYNSSRKEGNKFLIKFNHVADGLSSKDGEALRGFKIAGENKIFVDASVEIKGDVLIVWNDNVVDPISVRYAWADNPKCNLINSANLPASPFRTDDWPEVTFGKN
jgi:sialate O-acetylesterase